jgi:hypothetical protein
MQIPKFKSLRSRIALGMLGLFLVGCAVAYRQYVIERNRWIDIGQNPYGDKISYRLMDMDDGHGKTLKRTHSDLASITVQARSGKAIDAWIYLPIYGCSDPKMRANAPTVRCETLYGADDIIVELDNVREALLGLQTHGKYAAVLGKIVGTWADNPVLMVSDARIPD